VNVFNPYSVDKYLHLQNLRFTACETVGVELVIMSTMNGDMCTRKSGVTERDYSKEIYNFGNQNKLF